jgi:hypothetical protein
MLWPGNLNLDLRNSPEGWQLLKLKKQAPREQSPRLPLRHTLSNVSFSASLSLMPQIERSSGPN